MKRGAEDFPVATAERWSADICKSVNGWKGDVEDAPFARLMETL